MTDRRHAFTLVELMTVVAIIGILAAIALPLVYFFQLKAKRAEIPVNIDALGDAATAYYAAFDTYGTSSVSFQPGPYWDQAAHPWDDGSIPAIFVALGWAPDGDVRGSYFYNTDDATFVWMIGESDLDDNAKSYYRRDAIEPGSGAHTSPDLETCLGGGSVVTCF
jgi:prepilin-type N-terminal cleavage/methylation domain-containing protein